MSVPQYEIGIKYTLSNEDTYTETFEYYDTPSDAEVILNALKHLDLNDLTNLAYIEFSPENEAAKDLVWLLERSKLNFFSNWKLKEIKEYDPRYEELKNKRDQF